MAFSKLYYVQSLEQRMYNVKNIIVCGTFILRLNNNKKNNKFR